MFPELQQVIPERTRQGTKPFQRRHDAFPAEGLHLACASGGEPQLPPPILIDLRKRLELQLLTYEIVQLQLAIIFCSSAISFIAFCN